MSAQPRTDHSARRDHARHSRSRSRSQSHTVRVCRPLAPNVVGSVAPAVALYSGPARTLAGRTLWPCTDSSRAAPYVRNTKSAHRATGGAQTARALREESLREACVRNWSEKWKRPPAFAVPAPTLPRPASLDPIVHADLAASRKRRDDSSFSSFVRLLPHAPGLSAIYY